MSNSGANFEGLTSAEGVKVTEKGAANGVATLNSETKLPLAQVPKPNAGGYFEATFGNASATTFTIEHSLNTLTPNVTIINQSTSFEEGCNVEIINANKVKLSATAWTATPPGNAAYRVSVDASSGLVNSSGSALTNFVEKGEVGANSGVAPLTSGGVVPENKLPAFSSSVAGQKLYTRHDGKLEYINDIINVDAWGADPTGKANSTEAIEAAQKFAGEQTGGPNNIPGGTLGYSAGATYLANITLASGVNHLGLGSGCTIRPFNKKLPCISGPQTLLQNGSFRNIFLFGYGISGERNIPYTPVTGQGSFPSKQAYNMPLTLATEIISGSKSSAIVVNAPSHANIIPAGATLIINNNGTTVQPVTVSSSTEVTSSGTTSIPVTAFTASAVYTSMTPIMVSGGFAHGIFLPMGIGSEIANTLSGSFNYTFENVIVWNFGNNNIHIEGGNYFQTHQFDIFRNIFARYSTDADWYLFGELQANKFDACKGYWSKWNCWMLVAYLQGAQWFTPNANKFADGLANGSGIYQGTEGKKEEVTTVTYGIWNEGSFNTWDGFYIEANGKSAASRESGGVYNFYTPVGKAGNIFLHCHFAEHYIDYFDRKGNGNQIWWSNWEYGNSPTEAQPFIRLYGGSEGALFPVIGPQRSISTTKEFIYCAETYTEKNPIIYTQGSVQGGGGSNIFVSSSINFTKEAAAKFAGSLPVKGKLSEIIFNTQGTSASPESWICVEAGEPGKYLEWNGGQIKATLWKSFASLGTKVEQAGTPNATGRLEAGSAFGRLRESLKIKSGENLEAGEILATLPVSLRPINSQKAGMTHGTSSIVVANRILISIGGVCTLTKKVESGEEIFLDGVTFPMT